MSTYLSIDPGLRGLGAALWSDGKLVAAKYVLSPAITGSGAWECAEIARHTLRWAFRDYGHALDDLRRHVFSAFNCVAVEFPQTYGGRAGKGDANDLFPLAAVDGAFAALLPKALVQTYRPHEWKGSIQKPKSVKDTYPIVNMVKERLDPVENLRVEWPTNKRHGWDVADAIGVGLKALRRFEQMRVLARE